MNHCVYISTKALSSCIVLYSTILFPGDELSLVNLSLLLLLLLLLLFFVFVVLSKGYRDRNKQQKMKDSSLKWAVMFKSVLWAEAGNDVSAWIHHSMIVENYTEGQQRLWPCLARAVVSAHALYPAVSGISAPRQSKMKRKGHFLICSVCKDLV